MDAIKLVTVTPKQAAQWLDLNRNIRSMSESWVRVLVNLIQAGRFEAVADPVQFDEDGWLVNGQHRLSAIVRAGKAVPMYVQHGVTQAQLASADRGRRRALSDSLGLDRRLASPLNFAVRYGSGRQSFPDFWVEEVARREPGFALAYLVERSGSETKFFSSAAWKVGAMIHMLTGAGWDYVGDLYDALVRVDVAELPPVGISIMRQAMAGAVSATEYSDTLARSLVVFDPSRRNIAKVQVRDTGKEEAIATLREVMAPHLADLVDS